MADPIVGFFRVGYRSGAEGYFVPWRGAFNIDVYGSDARAYAWDNGETFCVRRAKSGEVEQRFIQPQGESPTVCTIRNIIQELETGEPTAGRIDITMQAVEVQFGIAYSHLQGGARVDVPVADRSLYIPGG